MYLLVMQGKILQVGLMNLENSNGKLTPKMLIVLHVLTMKSASHLSISPGDGSVGFCKKKPFLRGLERIQTKKISLHF